MSSTQEKRCRTCAHWGLDMICQNEDSGEQGYTCMPGAACGHWEGTGEPEERHGRWIEVTKHRDENGTILTDYECSECFAMLKDSYPEEIESERFCYNCGADMREGGADNG